MNILAQLPNPDTVIETATNHGWEAGMVAFILIGLAAAMTYVLKRQYDSATHERDKANSREERILKANAEREIRMANRIDALEDMLSSRLMAINAEMVAAMISTRESLDAIRETMLCVKNSMERMEKSQLQLCQLLAVCPCLFIAKQRGKVKLVDVETGKEISLEDVPVSEGI